MAVKIFASELSACRVKKLIYGIIIGITLFVIFIVFPIMWIFHAPIPKTTKDFVYDYITRRETYTYQTVNDAFHNPYQYIYPLYDKINAPLIGSIESNQTLQGFTVQSITHDLKDSSLWLVRGILFRCNYNMATQSYDCTVKNKTFKVKEINGKFIVENSNNG